MSATITAAELRKLRDRLDLRWFDGNYVEWKTAVFLLDGAADQLEAREATTARWQRILISSNPIDSDHAVVIAELAKNVMYWKGIDFALPTSRDFIEAKSHMAVLAGAIAALDAQGVQS